MSNPLLLDIVLYLQGKGLVEGDGIDAFRDFSPEYPDSVVMLIEYAGDPAHPVDVHVNRSVQVTVRDKVSDVARDRARSIYQALYSDQETRRIDFTEDRWGQVYLRQPPFKIKTDENNRAIFGFNMGITTTIE